MRYLSHSYCDYDTVTLVTVRHVKTLKMSEAPFGVCPKLKVRGGNYVRAHFSHSRKQTTVESQYIEKVGTSQLSEALRF